jgi:rod shape-determining protein MreC
VLLLSDPNSRVSVMGKDNRSQGIVVGQGRGRNLKVEYIKLNAPIEPGEMLVTSGLSGIFPKGLPVARVKTVHRSDISLFLSITAEPLVDVNKLEEVLLLKRMTLAGGHNATSVN